tara:strand:+ start:622 stop:1524 length:903 start_codon:yes stop_codon:yes gene_type:complete
MATYLVYFANNGTPTAGLSPTVTTYINASTGASLGAGPTITEVGGGFYSFTVVPTVDTAIVIDGTATLTAAADRYLYSLLTGRDASPSLIAKDSPLVGPSFADLDEGNGTRAVTLTVNDGTDPVANVSVTVKGDGTNTYFASASTNAAGQVLFSLQDGAYDLYLYAPGYTFTTPTDLTVSGNTTLTISGTAATITPPSSAALCRVFLNAVNFSGAAVQNVRIVVENLFQSPVQSLAITVGSAVFVTNAAGHAEFDLVRGGVFRISIGDTPISKQITVPNAATADLLTLLGAPQDSFTVVA